MSNYIVTDSELTSVANAIRTKGGTNGSLVFPGGFISAISNISGGGGSSDFSTATVTLTNSSNAAVYLSYIISDEVGAIVDVIMYESGTYNVLLYEGYSSGVVGPDSNQSLPTITVTGDIENDSGYLTVTGNGTITIS